MKNKYEFRDGHVVVFIINQGITSECLIDLEDFEKVNSNNGLWGSTKHHTGRYYARSIIKGKTVLMHRHILNPSLEKVVDHINFNTLDNRRSNLRLLSTGENSQNRFGATSRSNTGIRGVNWHKQSSKWRATLMINKKQIYLGGFKDIELAKKAVVEGRKKYLPYSI